MSGGNEKTGVVFLMIVGAENIFGYEGEGEMNRWGLGRGG